jgi:hypothetical protein
MFRMTFSRRLLFSLMLLPQTALAQPVSSEAARRYPQPVRVGDLLKRKVLRPLESQPSLGRVRTVVLRDGQIEVVIDYGGVLGFFTRPVAVPVEAMALLGQHMVMLGFTPAQLDALPNFTDTSATLLAPDAIVRIGLTKPAH